MGNHNVTSSYSIHTLFSINANEFVVLLSKTVEIEAPTYGVFPVLLHYNAQSIESNTVIDDKIAAKTLDACFKNNQFYIYPFAYDALTQDLYWNQKNNICSMNLETKQIIKY